VILIYFLEISEDKFNFGELSFILIMILNKAKILPAVRNAARQLLIQKAGSQKVPLFVQGKQGFFFSSAKA